MREDHESYDFKVFIEIRWDSDACHDEMNCRLESIKYIEND